MSYHFYASILNERNFVITFDIMEHNTSNSGVFVHNLFPDHLCNCIQYYLFL